MITRIEPGTRLSEASVHGGLVYLAGQVPADTSQAMFGQTQQILANIDRILAKAGSHKSRLISCTIYITDLAQFSEMNRAWDAWVDPSNLPARATVEVKLANPAWLVEIQGMAAA